MNRYEVIIIILVVLVVSIIRNVSKKKKGRIVPQAEETDSTATKEEKNDTDETSQSLFNHLNSSHWTTELMNRVKSEPVIRNAPLTAEIIEIVAKVIAIPDIYYKGGDKSWSALVVESGYIEAHEQITKQVILDALTNNRHRIDEWVQWSEDQRVSEGWFLRTDDGIPQIGAFSTDNGYKETLTSFPNIESACAAFIKIKMESTRKNVKANNIKRKKKK